MYFMCCKILGVKPGADLDTIKSAYRKAAKELHPDINPSDKAQEYFIILKNAYQYLLTHPYTEREIDLILKRFKAGEKQPDLKQEIRPAPHIRFRVRSLSLHEVLRQSPVAQALYIFFHAVFITAGLYLVVRPVYDIIFVPLARGVSAIPAYFSLIFAIIFGFVLTSTFLYSGYRYLKGH